MIEIQYGQIDPKAKADITSITAPDRQSWSTLDDLRRDDEWLPRNCATLEHNAFLLDGEQELFPDQPANQAWGYWSATMSDEDGIFTSPPSLEFAFGENHKSRSLTLFFYSFARDYADRIRVTWFDSGGSIIQQGEYEIADVVDVVDESVTDYRRVRLEFLSTNLPGRYLRLYALTFGLVRLFEDSVIDSCNVTEEINPIADSLPVNSLEFTLRTKDPVFSPVSGELADDMMMTQQWLRVTCDNQPFGVFFLEDWEDMDQSGAHFRFRAEDALYVLDQYEFCGGMYEKKLVSELLREIFQTAFPTGLARLELDDSYATARVSGWLPVSSCREAMLQVCFVLQALADTSRGGALRIYPQDRVAARLDMPHNHMYQGGKIRSTTYYNGAEVTSYTYTPGGGTMTAYQGTLSAGQHRIKFSEPLHALSVSGATILDNGANYVDLQVAVERSVTVTGTRYIQNMLVHNQYLELSSGMVDNVATFDCTLIRPEQAQNLAAKVLEYLKFKLLLENRMLLAELQVGEMVRVATHGRDLLGMVERLDIDLRAKTAQVRVVGNVDPLEHS